MTFNDPQASPSFQEAERFVNRWRRSRSPEPWVVAVSGGSDSVGLLRFLHGLGLKLSVAHLNHGSRGEASRLDAEFVEKLAETLQVPFDLGHWQPSRSSHFEADAREARLDWLASVAAKRGASAVVLGHTLDDQAETVLHRALRGTGLRGLAGIPSRRLSKGNIHLLRPLLGVTRGQIRERLALEHQGYREDASNTDPAQTRSRLRHDLIPKLEADYNPKVVEALGRLAAFASDANRALERRLAAIERKVLIESTADITIYHKSAFAQRSPMIRVELLRRAWRRSGRPEREMDNARWKRLARLADEAQSRLSIGGGFEAEVTEATLIIRRAAASKPPVVPSNPVALPVPGVAEWLGTRVVATLEPMDASQETIDLDRLAEPLYLRAPRPGDRFEPLGLNGQGMPLNDFLRGRGVARSERPEIPLLCDQEGIIWVIGHRISHRVRLVEETSRRLWLRSGCD